MLEENTREAAKAMVETGVIRTRAIAKVDAIHHEVRRLRLSYFPEVALQAGAIVLAIITISAEIDNPNMIKWHTDPELPHTFTVAGLWAMLVALPILNYIWLRLAWKIIIWTCYLYRITRVRLILVASHPDRTGGIGFISRAQAKYAIVIFAYGVSNIAAVVAYKVGVEGASLTLLPVWFPIVGFVVGAPLLFTAPLFMFTKQLHRTKKRASGWVSGRQKTQQLRQCLQPCRADARRAFRPAIGGAAIRLDAWFRRQRAAAVGDRRPDQVLGRFHFVPGKEPRLAAWRFSREFEELVGSGAVRQ